MVDPHYGVAHFLLLHEKVCYFCYRPGAASLRALAVTHRGTQSKEQSDAVGASERSSEVAERSEDSDVGYADRQLCWRHHPLCSFLILWCFESSANKHHENPCATAL